MQKLLTLPMRSLLTIKLWGARRLLTMAEEQTQDARSLVCGNCSTAGINCERPHHCRVQPLKDREDLLRNALLDTNERLDRLNGV